MTPQTSGTMSDRVLIVDGLNAFLRNWSVNPTMDSNGEHIGGMLGTLRSIKNLVRDTACTRVVVAWDGKGGSRRRRGIFAEYKAGRKPRVNRQYDFETVDESQANLRVQYEKTRRYLDMLGVSQVEVEDCEADDVISVLCAFVFPDVQKVIVSTDHDFYQLVDERTIVYSPVKKVFVGPGDVKEETGLLPCNYVLARAMTGGGDGSDNIHGVKGLGPKTVLKLFPELGKRECNLQEVKEWAQVLEPKTKHEKALVEGLLAGWELVITNVRLMQLSNPMISPQSVGSIRHQLGKDVAQVNTSSIKLALLRDGIQLVDGDFFLTFQNYKQRHDQSKEEKQNV